MTTTPAIRIAIVLGTVALFVGALATGAGAGIRDGRSPDTKDVANRYGPLDPAIATAIASHQAVVAADDKRSPDTKDVAAQYGRLDPAIATAIETKEADVARSAPHQVSVVAPAFDWTDAAIGAFAGFAIALILGGTVLLTHRGRDGSLAV